MKCDIWILSQFKQVYNSHDKRVSSSMIQCCIVHRKSASISEEHAASIFGLKSKPTKKPASFCMQDCSLVHISFLLGLLFKHEDGGSMFFWNIGWLSTDYMMLYPRRNLQNYQCENITSYNSHSIYKQLCITSKVT
jgi:hypothetical protein